MQNDDAKNSLWRPTAVKNPRSGNSGTTQNKGKAHVPMSSNKRPHGSIGHNNYGSYGNFENDGIKGAFGSKVSWGHPKDAKADFKSTSKSHISDKKTKFGTSGFKSESKNYDLWNEAKDKLIADEYNKRNKTIACINRGEVGNKFSYCLNPKPKLLESFIDSTVPITRTPISEQPFVIDESCIVNLNSDYPIDSIEHRLKYLFDLNNNIGCNIDTSLTSVEALTPDLGNFSNEVLIPLNKRVIEPRLK